MRTVAAAGRTIIAARRTVPMVLAWLAIIAAEAGLSLTGTLMLLPVVAAMKRLSLVAPGMRFPLAVPAMLRTLAGAAVRTLITARRAIVTPLTRLTVVAAEARLSLTGTPMLLPVVAAMKRLPLAILAMLRRLPRAVIRPALVTATRGAAVILVLRRPKPGLPFVVPAARVETRSGITAPAFGLVAVALRALLAAFMTRFALVTALRSSLSAIARWPPSEG